MGEFETHLNDLLVEVFNQILKFEEASLRSVLGSSITITEAHILEAIGRQDEKVTVSEIASILDITVPTTTVALKKLESKGFITKTACKDDARRYIIGLTQNGKIINRAHDMFHRKMIADIICDLNDEERDALLSCVKKLNDFFGKKVES